MIGVIADDVTGATDVAAALRRRGLRTLLVFDDETKIGHVGDSFDVTVIALKSRNIDAAGAVKKSLGALDLLRVSGAESFYFKYCSTFDSSESGNIGPVTEALAEALGEPIVVTTPSSPDHQRTVYRGHLFLGDTLLAESHMRHHPVTPMKDSSVVRLLQAQSTGKIGLLNLDTIREGAAAVRAAIEELQRNGVTQVVADASSNQDLTVIAQAREGHRLAAGAAGLITGIARGVGASRTEVPPEPIGEGPVRTAIIAGSCSARTVEQVNDFRHGHAGPSYFLDSRIHADAGSMSAAALDWYDSQDTSSTPLIYSSLPPEELAAVQLRMGSGSASALFEEAAGIIARGLVARGVTRLVSAGGETSGAIIQALGIRTAVVGAEAATGVPWISSRDHELSLALKSGNFGDPDFLTSVAHGGSATTPGGRND